MLGQQPFAGKLLGAEAAMQLERQTLITHMASCLLVAGPSDVAACCKAAWTSPVRTAATSTIQHDGEDASTSGAARAQHSNTTDWDWAFVIGAKAGRKPAIKRMQVRHKPLIMTMALLDSSVAH